MTPLVVGGIVDIISKGLDVIFPDPAVAAQYKLELLKEDNQARLQELEMGVRQNLAQMEINKMDAASGNVWASGWRPAFGWMCAATVLSQYILRPYLPWVLEAFGFYLPPIPSIDMEIMWPLIFGLMGLSFNRSQDKARGKA